MDFDELQELIRILEASELCEMEIEEDGRRIRLSKEPSPVQVITSGVAESGTAAPPGSSTPEPAAPAEDGAGHKLVTIDSPMVGTFYTASAPGEAPFVLAGDTVEPDQTVCIVEAMKIMNEVTAKFPGIIDKVLVENGEPVEFGQPLFTVGLLA